jgi:hypothetical protein
MWVVFPITAQVKYQSAQTMCVVRHDFTSNTKGAGLPVCVSVTGLPNVADMCRNVES